MRIEDLLDRAKELISKGTIKGSTNQLLKQAVEDNPEELEGFLIDIAQQAQDEYSSKVTKRIYGNELVGIAMAYKISKKEAEEEDNPKLKKRTKALPEPDMNNAGIKESLHTKLLALLMS